MQEDYTIKHLYKYIWLLHNNVLTMLSVLENSRELFILVWWCQKRKGLGKLALVHVHVYVHVHAGM